MQISFREWDNSVFARRAAALLGSDEIHVWTARVPTDEAGLSSSACLLSPDECERAEQFSRREPRRQFVFGRALLRQLLGTCLKVEPAALAFGYQARGKPFLVHTAAAGNLCFSLSHSGGIVAIALARGHEMGVDIEALHNLRDWLLLARRILSPPELGALFALPAPQQQKAFLNGWTRKEAYLKATGEGLIDALSDIEVTLAPGEKPALLRLPATLNAPRQWAICAIPLPPNYVGALVYEK